MNKLQLVARLRQTGARAAARQIVDIELANPPDRASEPAERGKCLGKFVHLQKTGTKVPLDVATRGSNSTATLNSRQAASYIDAAACRVCPGCCGRYRSSGRCEKEKAALSRYHSGRRRAAFPQPPPHPAGWRLARKTSRSSAIKPRGRRKRPTRALGRRVLTMYRAD
jgi:hypothetical protein